MDPAGSAPSTDPVHHDKGVSNPDENMRQGSGPLAHAGAKFGRHEKNKRNNLRKIFGRVLGGRHPPGNIDDGDFVAAVAPNYSDVDDEPQHDSPGDIGVVTSNLDPHPAAVNNDSAPSTAAASGDHEDFLETVDRLVREHNEIKQSRLDYRRKNEEYLLAIKRAKEEKSALEAKLEVVEAELEATERQRQEAVAKLAESEQLMNAMAEALNEVEEAEAAAQALAREIDIKLAVEKQAARDLEERLVMEKEEAAQRVAAALEREVAAEDRAIQAQRKVDHLKRKCDRYVRVLFGRVEEHRASNGVAKALRRQYEQIGAAFQDLSEKLERASVLEEERHSVQENLHRDICAALGIDAAVVNVSSTGENPALHQRFHIIDAVRSVDRAFDSCASDLLSLIQGQHRNLDHFVDALFLTLYKLSVLELLCSTFFSDFESRSYGGGGEQCSPGQADALLNCRTSFNDIFANIGARASSGDREWRRFCIPRERKKIAFETYQRCRMLRVHQLFEQQADLTVEENCDTDVDSADLSGGGGSVDDIDEQQARDNLVPPMRSVREEFYRFAQGKWCPHVIQNLLDSSAVLAAVGGGASAGGEGRRWAADRLPEELMSEENPLRESFGEAARSVWLLHKVAQWLQAEMVIVPREAAFDPEYMDAVHSMTPDGGGEARPPPPSTSIDAAQPHPLVVNSCVCLASLSGTTSSLRPASLFAHVITPMGFSMSQSNYVQKTLLQIKGIANFKAYDGMSK